MEFEAVCDLPGILWGSSFIYSVFSSSRLFYHTVEEESVPLFHQMSTALYAGHVGSISAMWKNLARNVSR